MTASRFTRLVDEYGQKIIFETWMLPKGIRVRVLASDTLDELERFTLPRFPDLRYQPPEPRWQSRNFVRGFTVPEQNLANWEINRKNLVRSTGLFDGVPLERISWHPPTGEMLLSGRCQSYHAHDIHNHGSHPFEEFVRALVLPENRIVATRPFCPIDPRDAASNDHRDMRRISVAAQVVLRTVLVTAGLPKNWRFVFNTNNRHLEQISGRRGW